MSGAMKWWSRLSAAALGAVLTLVVPVHAWAASTGADNLVYEAVKSRGRRGGFGFLAFGAVCCIGVVVIVVVALVLISKKRKRR